MHAYGGRFNIGLDFILKVEQEDIIEEGSNATAEESLEFLVQATKKKDQTSDLPNIEITKTGKVKQLVQLKETKAPDFQCECTNFPFKKVGR